MGKFLGFVGGILAAIIGGYGVWYLTRPITVEGMVIDRSTNNPVGKAMVSVQIGSSSRDSFHDRADENGSFGVELTGSAWRSTVVLLPAVAGYRDEGPTRVVVTLGVNHHDLYVIPLASAPVPPSTGGTPGANHPAMAHPPAYIRRATMEKVFVKKYP